MKFGPLSLFTRTSCRRTFNLASWHSRHSLTWRWILSFSRCTFRWPAAIFHMTRGHCGGFGLGFAPVLSFYAHRNGDRLWSWGFSLLWHSVSFQSQRPMWFYSLCQKAWNEELELRSTVGRLRRKLEAIEHNAARAENPAAVHLN